MQSAGFVCALQYRRAPDELVRRTALQLDSAISNSQLSVSSYIV